MNFLLYTASGIGDIMQKLPMASAIKAQYPDANIDFLMGGPPSVLAINHQILECQHYVRNIYWYINTHKLHFIKLLLQLRSNHYDLGIIIYRGTVLVGRKPTMWVFRLMRWGGVKKVAGLVRDQVDIFADVPEFAHYIERDRMTLDAAGITAPMTTLTIDKSKIDFGFENYDKLKQAKKIIAFSVGTNVYPWETNGKTMMYDVKSWAYERWMELAVKLAGQGFDVVLLGGRKEQHEMAEGNISVPEGEHIFNFIGRTTLKQSLALLSMCSLVVGAEGGMMHCASGLGVKTLTIFGGSDHRIWTPVGGEIIRLHPECAPCFSTRRAPECTYHKCLEDVTVDIVLDRITSMNI